MAILFKGKSTERKISKMTANEVLRNLDRKKYEILPIYVAKDGISNPKLLDKIISLSLQNVN